jgi:EAL domain-containing protein (putative c-di-GMP-specific phosphodiesterase class I)
VFRGSDAAIVQRRNDMGWAARLNAALEDERFMLYYQAYQALGAAPADGTAAPQHVEILLRLRDEQGHTVPPGEFMPAAERYNVMPAIDRWVIRTVFSRYADLAAQLGSPGLTCGVNLSGTSLNAEGLLEFIQTQARAYNLPPGAVCFEVTETAAIHNVQQAAQFMRAVKAMGFSFALDDFGVGSSSFGYLKHLPVDLLKIDGSFVRDMVQNPVDRAMVDTINRVGHIMGLKTVAEFAENAQIIDGLRTLGVDYAQGFGVHRPQPLPSPLAALRVAPVEAPTPPVVRAPPKGAPAPEAAATAPA